MGGATFEKGRDFSGATPVPGGDYNFSARQKCTIRAIANNSDTRLFQTA
jgi:hypothetical protein